MGLRESDPAGPEGRAGPAWAWAALLCAVALGQAGALSAGFVWDDAGLVLRNSDLERPFLEAVSRAFTGDLWAGTGEPPSGYYRPLMLISLAVDRAVAGRSAEWAHAHNLLWHLAATALVVRLAQQIRAGAGAWAAGLLFGLHPAQAEAVIWVAARNDLMAAALGLGALGAAAAGRPVRAFAWAALAGLSKESVLLLPGLLLCFDHARGRRSSAPAYGAILSAVALSLGLRVAVGVGGATWPPPEGWALLLGSAPELVGELGGLLILPWPLSVGRALEYLDRQPALVAAVGAGGAALGGAGLLLRGGPAGRAGLAWAALAFLPALISLADKGWLGERYLYLPMAGLGLALAPQIGRRAAPVLVVLAIGGGALTQLRARDWSDDLRLWGAAWAVDPSPFVADALGRTLRLRGEAEAALPWFVTALDDPQPFAPACPQVVSAALDAGRPVLAAQLGHWAATRGCSGPGFSGLRAEALAASGEWAAAEVLLPAAAGDPVGRGQVVQAALWARAGDPRFEAAAAAWTGPTPLAEQVRGLRVRAGDLPPD